MPLVINEKDIFATESIAEYMRFWNRQYRESFEMAREFPFNPNSAIWKEVAFYQEVSTIIADIIYYVKDLLHPRLIKHSNDPFLTKDELDDLNREIEQINQIELEKLFNHLNI